MANPQKTILNLIRAIRPIHWVKNLSVFAALVFSGSLFDEELFIKTVWAFVVFSLAASTTYLFNDILDASADKNHPNKKFRPIASGNLSKETALATSFALGTLSLYLASILNPIFFYLTLFYLLLQLGYSLGLKSIAIIDILIIATGFIIRVYAGAFVIDAHLSVWFLLCVVSVALFLASGKRRAEFGVVDSTLGTTRTSLKKYSTELLNSYVTMFGNAAWLSWSLFTFFESPTTNQPLWLFLAELSRATTISKLLMITIPVAIFAIMRYESLIFENRSEAPEKLLLTDRALTFSVGLWVAMVVWILYAGASFGGI